MSLVRSIVSACVVMLAVGRLEAAQLFPARIPQVEFKDVVVSAPLASTLSSEELAGGALFDQRCVLCHSIRGSARGPRLDESTVRARGEARVREMILDGSPRMPGWKYTLTPDQVTSLVAYLKTLMPAVRGTR